MPTYSRGEIVSTLTNFYNFLATMYIPVSDVVHPPPGGWPHITKENVAFLGKTDRAVDLLRHIPYIRQSEQYRVHLISDLCYILDYSGYRLKDYIRKGKTFNPFDPFPEITTLPPHVITLADQWQGREGTFLLLDTERATIVHFSPHWARDPTELSMDVPEGSNEIWRKQATYSIPEFFEDLKQEFIDLRLLPTDKGECQVAYNGCKEHEAIRKIWRAHGWPSDNFDKDACLDEVREVQERSAGLWFD